ncbi:MAG: glycosyltransferase [Nitrospirota bacterium]|nr:glycosyltransferase [Nitrospirota bacterium]
MNAPDLPHVSVIIPVHNDRDTLGEVLGALSGQDYPHDRFEVIVVDNNSTDGSGALARECGASVLEERQPGSYAARNRGIGVARGEILAFLDGDCIPDSQWLGGGVNALLSTPADLAGGRIDITARPGAGLLAHYERLSYMKQRENIADHGTAATANLLVRKTVFERVGPFRADLLSGGDGEFCHRAQQAGFVITYAEVAVVRHRAVSSVGRMLSRYRRLGRGEADLARIGVAPFRPRGSSFLSRRIAYAKRVWGEPGLSIVQRVAILLLNLAAAVAQEQGRVAGKYARRSGSGGPLR